MTVGGAVTVVVAVLLVGLSGCMDPEEKGQILDPVASPENPRAGILENGTDEEWASSHFIENWTAKGQVATTTYLSDLPGNCTFDAAAAGEGYPDGLQFVFWLANERGDAMFAWQMVANGVVRWHHGATGTIHDGMQASGPVTDLETGYSRTDDRFVGNWTVTIFGRHFDAHPNELTGGAAYRWSMECDGDFQVGRTVVDLDPRVASVHVVEEGTAISTGGIELVEGGVVNVRGSRYIGFAAQVEGEATVAQDGADLLAWSLEDAKTVHGALPRSGEAQVHFSYRGAAPSAIGPASSFWMLFFDA